MSLYVEFVGGPDNGQLLPVPDHEPETILMPLPDNYDDGPAKMAVYRKSVSYVLQEDGKTSEIMRYEFKGIE